MTPAVRTSCRYYPDTRSSVRTYPETCVLFKDESLVIRKWSLHNHVAMCVTSGKFESEIEGES